MTRAATRSRRTWGTWIGFESCPRLLDRLVEGFSGPWTRLEDLTLPAVPTVDENAEDANGKAGDTATGAPEDEAYACVVLAARSPADVRRAVPMRGLLPRARRVRVAIAEAPSWAPPPLPGGYGETWRHLADLRVVRAGRGWLLDAAFAEAVAPGDVLAHVAHGLAGARPMPQPVAGLAGPGAARWRPGDPNATPAPERGPVPGRRDAPGCDVLLRVTASAAALVPAPARPPEEPARQREPAEDGPPVVERRLPGLETRPRPELLPPVDEAVVNPIGFRPSPSLPAAVLVAGDADRGLLIACGERTVVRLPADGEITDVDVARLRDVRCVAVPALPGRAVVAARIVAALAAAGVPMTATPDAARDAALGPGLAAALRASSVGDLDDDLRREELSIRLRRCALRNHGVLARWRGLAGDAGLPVPPRPAVSILLATRRPDMIASAVRQLERQRGVTAELIVGLHGVPAREAAVGSALLPVTVVEAPAGMPFGAVLNRMAAAASGSLLAKVDDDDWYGPDHLADLLLARLYSGADLVGSAAEFVYLEPLDVTIRRCIGTERYAPQVAGGTMLITRAAFEAVGGFRPLPRTVDGQLLEAVLAAGGRVYRTHGFNYVLRRRNAQGHTWRQPVQSFLASYQAQWRGLVFNDLMESAVPHER
ncbi:glycosyl transferase family 2 [Microbispora sp. RL4-1S]|uniref:Glycosyl transferase family 2 n=1 Tax=Microbispora oryzae TaxID=2806554 RepID=A0A941AJB9_9ACTN|nr:glycosyl transferase family 2 [Microbispora oryzae]MBP2704802.1 glycosyl transferase family 2 [Microbispora oryzae]